MKKNKLPRLQTLYQAVLMALPIMTGVGVSHAETNTNFANGALAGAAIQYSPNVLLALSVEYPTAGLAYNSTADAEGNPRTYYNKISIKKRYLGYFDNRKCYTYVADSADSDALRAFANSGYVTQRPGLHNNSKDNQEIFRDTGGGAISFTYKPINPNTIEYFKVSDNAVDTADGIGLCSGNNPNEFSGNMLNWATMSSIDIFRQALTGGNRAATMQTTDAAYQLGDAPDATYLRRAKIQWGQNVNHFVWRAIYLPDNLLKRVMPAQYASDDINQFISYRTGQHDQYDVVRSSPGGWATKNLGEGNAVIWVDNNDFFVNFRRRFAFKQCSKTAWGGCSTYATPVNRALPIKSRYMPYQAVVRVCDDADSAQTYGTNHPTTSIQCTQYPNKKYKPTGLMQERAGDMRFGALGYVNVNNKIINGGVLRARMKSLLGETAIITPRDNTISDKNPMRATGTVPLGAEIDSTTGQFVVNPDVADAKQSKVPNSGVINYLNKFGDYAGYKTNDPAAELYYVAQRYLRNAGFPDEYLSFYATNPTYGTSRTYQMSELINGESETAKQWKDNFPIILDWDNPLVVSSVDNVRENACRPNQIILIGDTNTHYDVDLPKYDNSNVQNIETPRIEVKDPEKSVDVTSLASTVLDTEGVGAYKPSNLGASNSRAGFPALAYWGHINDIQKGLVGKQIINTFAIDVVEDGKYKENTNTYYLAAKYGGFAYDKDRTVNDDGTPYIPLPTERSSWTDDPVGKTSIPAFRKGVPRTYAIANSPENMVDALKNAINSSAGVEAVTQSRVTTDVSTEKAVDLVQGVSVLRSGFTEDSPTYSGTLKKQMLKLVSSSTETTSKGFTIVYNDNCATCWDAGKLLNSTYHNTTGWSARNVYTTVNGTATKFATTNASDLQSKLHEGVAGTDKVEATKLIRYVLGDNTNESVDDLRVRSGYLMGMVINSSPAAIRPLKANSVRAGTQTCKFSDTNFAERNKETRYAVAANDGMLHLFNSNGAEILAYLPNAVLPKLSSYAKKTYLNPAHDRWLNDGTPSVNDVCHTTAATATATTEARSILIGTTGRGGNSVYALDVTNLQSPNGNNILWDFSHDDLGMTIPAPVVTHDKDGKPIAIISSGYRKNGGTDKGYIFVLKDIDKKRTAAWVEDIDYYKIPLGKAGVGEIFALDANNDNAAEAIYVGDLEGKLWKLTLDADGKFAVNGGQSGATDKPLFEADASIVGQPAVQKISDKTYVVFATGRFFGDNDLPTTAKSLQNYAYGIIDKGDGVTVANNETSLLQQEIVVDKDKLTVDSGEYLKVTTNKFDATKQGWRLKLSKNMLNMDAAGIYKNRLAQFTLITPDDGSITNTDENICKRSGSTSTVLVDVRTGGTYAGNLFDTNNDGVYDSKDGDYSVFTQNNNIVQKALMLKTTNGTTVTIGYGSGGAYSAATNPLSFTNTLKRLSWREIY